MKARDGVLPGFDVHQHFIVEAKNALPLLAGMLVRIKPRKNCELGDWQWGYVSAVHEDGVVIQASDGEGTTIEKRLVVVPSSAADFAMDVLAGYGGNGVRRFPSCCPYRFVALHSTAAPSLYHLCATRSPVSGRRDARENMKAYKLVSIFDSRRFRGCPRVHPLERGEGGVRGPPGSR